MAGGLTRREKETTLGSRERTFVLIKPDGVHRGRVGEIISRLERRGLRLVGLRLLMPGREHFHIFPEHLRKFINIFGAVFFCN